MRYKKTAIFISSLFLVALVTYIYIKTHKDEITERLVLSGVLPIEDLKNSERFNEIRKIGIGLDRLNENGILHEEQLTADKMLKKMRFRDKAHESKAKKAAYEYIKASQDVLSANTREEALELIAKRDSADCGLERLIGFNNNSVLGWSLIESNKRNLYRRIALRFVDKLVGGAVFVVPKDCSHN